MLLNHEIGELRRIQRELKLIERIPAISCFSLVTFQNKYLDEKILSLLDSSLRKSDIVFYSGKKVLLFLPGTDKEGAIHLIEGIRDFMGEEGKYIIVSYPEDGETYEELMESISLYAKNVGLDVSSFV